MLAPFGLVLFTSPQVHFFLAEAEQQMKPSLCMFINFSLKKIQEMLKQADKEKKERPAELIVLL